MKECICKQCGELFETPHKRKYCCTSCKRKAQIKRTARHGKLDTYTKTCRVCGNKYEARTRRGYHCSTECFHRAVSIKKLYTDYKNVFYIIGFEDGDKHTVKMGIAKTIIPGRRLEHHQASNPRLLHHYFIKSFKLYDEAEAYETERLKETHEYRTEADNEWRTLPIDILIELCRGENIATMIPCMNGG